MTKRSKRKPKGGAASDETGGPPAPKAGTQASWVKRNWPIIQFVLVFAVTMGLFFAGMASSTMRETVFPAYLRLNATASAAVLRTFGEDAIARGASVSSPTCSLQIAKGCDAADPTALFLAAMLAFPASFRSKLPGMLLGVLALAAANFARIVLLYYVRRYWPDWFHIMHVEVFQVLFIALALVLWLIWAMWATRERKPQHDVAVATG